MLIDKNITSGPVEFAVLVDNRVKIKENNTIDKYLNLNRELKNAVDHDNDCDANWLAWNRLQRYGKKNWKYWKLVENPPTIASRAHIGQNPEKGPRD